MKHDITEITGSFGRWQAIIFGLFFYTAVIGIWQNFSITFLAPNMDYHCVNSTEKCVMMEGNSTRKCTQWEYDTSHYSQTIVTEWDLVCDRQWLISLAKSMYMIGFLISVFVFGQLSDWIGRKPVIVITYIIAVVSLILTPFSTSYTMFITLRFFQAFGRSGMTVTSYVLLMEMVGKKHQANVGIWSTLGWSLGFSILGGVAFLFRNWVSFQVAISVPFLPLIFAYPWIPESPRWLLMQGKTKELEKVLKQATRLNRKEFKISTEEFEKYQDQSPKSSKSVLDLLKTPRIRRWTISMIYIWMVNAFVYYGFSFNTNDLAGDPYINFTIAGALEFPCYAVVYYGTKRFGRRPLLTTLMIAGGVFSMTLSFLPTSSPWLPTGFAMAGKFCITSSFRLLYLYTNEIFPTVVRNVALGSCSMCARVGSILAPFVKELGVATYVWFPYVIYTLLAVSGGLIGFLLPETKERLIADTIDECENFTLKGEERNEINLQQKTENVIKSVHQK